MTSLHSCARPGFEQRTIKACSDLPIFFLFCFCDSCMGVKHGRGGWMCDTAFGCFLPLICADACWVNILNVRVTAYLNYFNGLHSCGRCEQSQSGKMSLPCWFELLNLLLLLVTQWIQSDSLLYRGDAPCFLRPSQKIVQYVGMNLLWFYSLSVARCFLSGSDWDAGLDGYECDAGLCVLGRACCESWGFSDRIAAWGAACVQWTVLSTLG